MGPGGTLRLTALFDPSGVLGRLCWCALTPNHAVLFTGILRSIAEAAGRDPDAS